MSVEWHYDDGDDDGYEEDDDVIQVDTVNPLEGGMAQRLLSQRDELVQVVTHLVCPAGQTVKDYIFLKEFLSQQSWCLFKHKLV